MLEYHKIQTVFRRDKTSRQKPLLEGEWTMPEFEYLAHNLWTFTEKVDGTNIRVMLRDGEVTFGGKTDSAQMPIPLLAHLENTFLPLVGKMREIFFGRDVCLYGEGYGAKIQKGGGNYRRDQAFVLFDVKVGDWWLRRDDVMDVADNLAIDAVPLIGQGTLFDAVAKVREGFLSVWGPFPAEGIVARPKEELRTRGGERVITKIKTRDFPVTPTPRVSKPVSGEGQKPKAQLEALELPVAKKPLSQWTPRLPVWVE